MLQLLQRRASALIAVCAIASTPLIHAAEPRSLSFVNTHGGEQVACVFAGGSDDAACLARLQLLMRDWRTGESHPMDAALFDLLYELRLLARSDAPFEIISAYRSPASNAQLRSKSSAVAEKSLHMQGKAMDVRLRGFPTQQLHALAQQLRRGGVGYYPASDFVHVDTGRVRAW